MTLGIAFIAVLLIAAAIGGVAYIRASRMRQEGRLHSLPAYHGIYSAIWVLVPAFLVLVACAPMQSRLIDQAVLSSPEGRTLPDFEMQRTAILDEARQIANGAPADLFISADEAQMNYATEAGAIDAVASTS